MKNQSLKSLINILQALKSLVWRYPLPLLSALVAFGLAVLMINQANTAQADVSHTHLKLFLEVLSAMLLFFTVDIISIWFKLDKAKRLGFYLLVVCVLGVHYYSINPEYLNTPGVLISRYLIFFILYFLLLTSVTFVHPSKDSWFWQYNYRLILTLIQSIGFSVVLLIGVVSAFWAIDNLFGMEFNEIYYGYIVACVLIVVHSLLFLLFFPEGPQQIQPDALYPNWLRIFAQYILLPLVLLYGSFLYIYVMKILLEHRMPNGWIALPILIYSGSGLAAYTLLFPLRQQRANKMVYAFMRFFFHTLLPLLTFYFLALYLRIKPYGFTESRYIMLMVGIWLSGISLYRIYKEQAPLMLIPQSLLVCILLSVIGPWGMYQWSTRSQTQRLKSIFIQSKVFVDNQLNFRDALAVNINQERAVAIQSILDYLRERDQLKQLHPWLNASDQTWLTKNLEQGNSKAIVNDIVQSLHLNLIDTTLAQAIQFNTMTKWGEGQEIPIPQSGKLFPLHWSAEVDKNSPGMQFDSMVQTCILMHESDTLGIMPLLPRLYQLIQFKQKARSSDPKLDIVFIPDSLSTIVHNQQLMYINYINLRVVNNEPKINAIKGFWFIPQ